MVTIETLSRQAADSLPALVGHFDDDRYCLTIRSNQSASNLSVGWVCALIVRDFLCVTHDRHLPRRTTSGRSIRALVNPRRVPFNRFQEWCQVKIRDGKKPFQFQIDVCKCVIQVLRDCDDVTEEHRDP